ncbi:MAG: hypothetical protein MZW92_78225 [Comamonadaceae bacterium]|nr:hypothetical protein [Comamonadaceae bacterium]
MPLPDQPASGRLSRQVQALPDHAGSHDPPRRERQRITSCRSTPPTAPACCSRWPGCWPATSIDVHTRQDHDARRAGRGHLPRSAAANSAKTATLLQLEQELLEVLAV